MSTINVIITGSMTDRKMQRATQRMGASWEAGLRWGGSSLVGRAPGAVSSTAVTAMLPVFRTSRGFSREGEVLARSGECVTERERAHEVLINYHYVTYNCPGFI